MDWYELNGIKYRINTVILYNFDEFDEPTFYLVEDISVNTANDNIVTSKCLLLKCTGFDPHQRAYNFIKTTEKKCFLIVECNLILLILHDVDNQIFVSLIKI